MAGIPHGYHEGSRSEYLALYVLSSFGTASPIPHQEDHGFDLYCTLADRQANMLWPQLPYTVQVKSNPDPWQLKNRNSVEWFIQHPTPILLCVVYRRELRLQFFQTFPKYYLWSIQSKVEHLQLLPDPAATEGKCVHGHFGDSLPLSAPILDFTVAELGQPAIFENARAVLRSWLELEYENLFRIAAKLPWWVAPDRYWPNRPVEPGGASGRIIQWFGVVDDTIARGALSAMRDTLNWSIDQLAKAADFKGAARVALVLRYFWPEEVPNDMFLRQELERLLGIKQPRYYYEAIDMLAELLDQRLGLGNDGTRTHNPSDCASSAESQAEASEATSAADRENSERPLTQGRHTTMSEIQRDALSRARLFIALARKCHAAERNEHEAFLEAAIIYGRTALLRLETAYENRVGWTNWWAPLLRNQSVRFLRNERNTIIHECPPRVGQNIRLDEGNHVAADYYYYGKDPNVRAVDTVEQAINETETLIGQATVLFQNARVVPEEEYVGITVYNAGGLVAQSRRLRDVAADAAKAGNQSDEATFATATLLMAGAGLEAILSEFAHDKDRALYAKGSFRREGVARKFQKLTHLDFQTEHPNASELMEARKAIAHSEPHAQRSRMVSKRINHAGAQWATQTLEDFAISIWGDELPKWFREIGLTP
jgi:hypothetical protein